ncbi:hypothetical protein Arub01_00320 [Actinomadura rubrobrunea]|uniref:Uncharacterized protein n=1 Tax=Actinomadura rubrobrunea TaxID=115335 RepID=A0A9W6UTI1_9ACTN|nr:hypothetical protein Arub01_00320 [Actinomadura rubrobrunea]
MLARRTLLFNPEPRLGWVFRDRRASVRPFSEPPPQERRLPAYLERRVTETEQLAHRRLRRTLPFTLTSAALLALLAAGTAAASSGAAVPVGVALLALSVAAPGSALTLSAVRHRDQARQAYELAYRQTTGRYQAELRQWQDRKQAHEAAEHARADARPEWNPVPRPSRRLDVFGGTLWSWEALLTTYGTSALAAQPLLVLDLSRELVSDELVALAEQAGLDVDTQLLPSGQASSTLLSGLPPRDLVDAIVESMHGGTPDAPRSERSMDDRILTKVCDALGEHVTLRRMAAALRVLMGEPENSDALTRDERRHILNELFSVEYRRQAHANLSRIESYIHPLEDLGTAADPSPRAGYLTRIALDSQARNVRAELLTDLIVQWVTHRITASDASAPALVVAGADELARRHLERLSDACERRGVPLTFMFRRLRDTSAELIGGGAVAFMRLGNHEDATRAADFIGRDHRFVLSQITKNVGGNESHTLTDTTGESDGETYGTSHTTGTSTSWGTSHSSGASYTGGGLFPEGSTSRSSGGNRSRSRSTSDSESRSVSTSRNWSAAYAYATGTNWSDSDSIQRVYEYAVEPVALQHLPDHALLLVESDPGGGRTLTPVECDPAIITLDRVSTTPQDSAADAAPQWLSPPAAPTPRPPLPQDPGPPPGYHTGPREEPFTQHPRVSPPSRRRPSGPTPPRQGPPPLFGGKE